MSAPRDAEERPSPIGWFRAILTAAVIAAVGVGVLVFATNAVMQATGPSRHTLVAIATAIFFIVLFVLAWVLRRLQARRLI